MCIVISCVPLTRKIETLIRGSPKLHFSSFKGNVYSFPCKRINMFYTCRVFLIKK